MNQRMPPRKDVLGQLVEHYANFAREQSKLGLPGYAMLGAHRTHILSVQSACLNAEAWETSKKACLGN